MRAEAAFLFPVLLAAAYSLVLRSGPPVTGTYAGGDSRSVWFTMGDQVKTFPIANVVRIVFEGGAAPLPQQKQTAPSGACSARVNRGVTDAPGTADKQRRFCEVIQDYREANMRFTNEPNPIKRAICSI